MNLVISPCYLCDRFKRAADAPPPATACATATTGSAATTTPMRHASCGIGLGMRQGAGSGRGNNGRDHFARERTTQRQPERHDSMTIYAYTEPNCTLPGYVNLHERDPGIFVLTVRASGSQDSQSMHLTREQVLNLVNDASVYLDGDYDQLNKNEAIRAARDYEAEARRAQVLDMALRTPGLSDHHDVLEAAAAYQAHITGQQPVSAAPDVKRMVNRFLGWPLPKTFYPDCGISFDGREPDAMNPHKSWPTGTNLLNAEEARAMFEHVLRDE